MLPLAWHRTPYLYTNAHLCLCLSPYLAAHLPLSSWSYSAPHRLSSAVMASMMNSRSRSTSVDTTPSTPLTSDISVISLAYLLSV
jgi:hypothetical protein